MVRRAKSAGANQYTWSQPAKFIVHAISTHSCIVNGNVHPMIQYMLSNFSQPRLEIEIGLQADEQSETIHTAKREDSTCICSSLHIQGRFTYTDSHRCPLHNDTMEHDCTSKNIISGLIVPSDGRLDTPRTVEDRCICTSLHIHGNSVNVRYYHRCRVCVCVCPSSMCPLFGGFTV